MARIRYRILVDWQQSGAWGDYARLCRGLTAKPAQLAQYVTPDARNQPAISVSRGMDLAPSLAQPAAGDLTGLALDNRGQTYSPGNAASPIYNLVRAGRQCRIAALPGDGTVRPLSATLIERPQQEADANDRRVTLRGLGTFSRLVGKRASTQLYEGIRTDQAFGYILDAVSWPAADRVIDTGRTTLDYWWLDDEDLFLAVRALRNIEGPGASCYEDALGRAIWEGRWYPLLTTRCTTVQHTLLDTAFARGYIYDERVGSIINIAKLEVRRRIVDALGVIWTYGATLTLAPNETRLLIARHSSGDPFKAAVAPVSPTDYTVTAGALASAATLNRTSGANVTITLVAGALGATLTGLQLRAQRVSVANTIPVETRINTSVSRTAYGDQVWPRDSNEPLRHEIDVGVAQNLVDAIAALWQQPRAVVHVPIINDTAANRTIQLAVEISDRVNIQESESQVNADFWVRHIGRTFDLGAHLAVLGCERVDATQYGKWGTSTWGTAGIAGAAWGF